MKKLSQPRPNWVFPFFVAWLCLKIVKPAEGEKLSSVDVIKNAFCLGNFFSHAGFWVKQD
jgi:hypothetical protein